ncbi:MAG TPA: tRNA uracil 4-sulfurtransferase ThiI [Bacilli bacterium]|nr:tRNA uracil 4-sulfurtransferase ThiI [Bacilli bacterium]
MVRQFMISFGELYTKGRNRDRFIRQLKGNIKHALHGFDNEVVMTHDHLYIRGYDLNREQDMLDILVDISGIFYVSIIEIYDKDEKTLRHAALDIMRRKSIKTFKIFCKRNDKTYPLMSDIINRMLAKEILQNTEMTVDVHKPDFTLEVKIYHNGAYFIVDKYKGAGGYPLGIVGQSLMMLSGGIDSPVAAYSMLKRGIRISCIHFASPPYTQEGVIYKLKELLGALNRYQSKIDLYVIPFTKLQEKIYEQVRPSYTITIMRRMMYRLSERLANRLHIKMLVNGESIGQVASQTLDSMHSINAVTTMPVIRPLATVDKEDIIKLARKIKTYDISIQPYEDCCTIFTPVNPETKPRILIAEEDEAKFDFEALIEEALDNLEHLIISQEDDIF